MLQAATPTCHGHLRQCNELAVGCTDWVRTDVGARGGRQSAPPGDFSIMIVAMQTPEGKGHPSADSAPVPLDTRQWNQRTRRMSTTPLLPGVQVGVPANEKG